MSRATFLRSVGGLRLSAMPATLLLLSALACNGTTQSDPRVTQIQELQDKLEQQGRMLAQKDEQIAAQATRIQSLQGLTGERAIENLVHVETIQIERLSGGFDEDGDGLDDGVVVYLKLLDQDGEAIKAAGRVRVRLMDLSQPSERQRVGELSMDPAVLRTQWYGRFLTSHYTLHVPWTGGQRPAGTSITILVTFEELLSGRSFQAQSVVGFSGAATPSS